MKIRVLTSLAVLAISAAAGAQDISATPAFGTVNLEGGFTPDPHTTELIAGGSIQVEGQGAGCTGYIASAPDVDLMFVAGQLPLNIYVTSEEDTTLVINLPDGSWYCNDDANGFNPAAAFASPQSGLYNIWVGTYDADSNAAATLKISELDPQW